MIIALTSCTSSNITPTALPMLPSPQSTALISAAPTSTPGQDLVPTPEPDQPTPEPAIATPIQSCSPTPPDALGPFYTPGAPQRNAVGQGYIIQGVVRSAVDCSPIANAQVEAWMAGPDGEYRDEYRATFFTDENGTYSFESHFPPPYSGRPSHHHLLVSAVGYQTLVTQHYPVQGENQAIFDLVLVPSQ